MIWLHLVVIMGFSPRFLTHMKWKNIKKNNSSSIRFSHLFRMKEQRRQKELRGKRCERESEEDADITFGSLNRVDRISGFTMATIWEGVTSVLHYENMHIDTTHTHTLTNRQWEVKKVAPLMIFTALSRTQQAHRLNIQREADAPKSLLLLGSTTVFTSLISLHL